MRAGRIGVHFAKSRPKFARVAHHLASCALISGAGCALREWDTATITCNPDTQELTVHVEGHGSANAAWCDLTNGTDVTARVNLVGPANDTGADESISWTGALRDNDEFSCETLDEITSECRFTTPGR